MFEQFTVGKKIACGFSLVLLLLAVVAGIARFALKTASEGFTSYQSLANDSNLAGRIQANMIEARFDVKNFLLNNKQEDFKKFEERWKSLQEFVSKAKKEIADPENAKKIADIASAVNDYREGFDKVVQLQAEGEKYFAQMNTNGPLMEKELTGMLLSARDAGDFELSTLTGIAMRDMLLGRLHGVKFYDTFNVEEAEGALKEFGNLQEVLGSIDSHIKEDQARKHFSTVSDLKVKYVEALNGMIKSFSERKKIVEGTLDRIGPRIDKDIEEIKLALITSQNRLGPVLQASNTRSMWQVILFGALALFLGIFSAFFITRGITGNIGRIVGGLSESADQVATASGQVSSSSQQLAEGASEQAASIEETSASIEEMSSMTKQNAQNADQADKLMQETVSVVSKASESMTDLTHSMQEISKASEETSKIIKTIDEIAFQTNLLALNAAVEAARAGEAGAGFAVVADEVRSLAMRAAEAAKNTAGLIEGTLKRVKEGSELVQKTSADFSQVSSGASKMGELVGEICAASREQAQGIEEVNKAISEMDKVVQQNASTAEESASASEELNAQAEQMKEFVTSLAALVGGEKTRKTKDRAIQSSPPERSWGQAIVSTQSYARPLAHSKDGRRSTKKTGLLEGAGAMEVRPEQVIPFEDGSFEEF